MTLRDIAVNNLRRRKMRAIFVLAGLLIGVTTVVTLLTLVNAMKNDINHKLEMYGANILIVPKTENLSLPIVGFRWVVCLLKCRRSRKKNWRRSEISRMRPMLQRLAPWYSGRR